MKQSLIMCILKVIDFRGCLYMLALGFKLYIYLYNDFL